MSYDYFLSMLPQQHLENLKVDPHHRFGQTFFNLLDIVMPDVADQIRGTLMDPFHKHYVDMKLIEHVGDLWRESEKLR